MITYGYKLDDGEVRDEQFPIGTAPATIRFGDGRVGHRSFCAEHTGTKRDVELRTAPGGWPRYSDALGCHPSQVKEFEKDSRDKGVPTHFTKDGRCEVQSPSHQKRYLNVCGMRDRAAWC